MLLGNLTPSHEIFSKNYQKPKKQKDTQVLYSVDNSDDFFTNLPPCKGTKKNSMGFGLNKQDKKIRKLEAMEKAYQHMAGRIALQRQELFEQVQSPNASHQDAQHQGLHPERQVSDVHQPGGPEQLPQSQPDAQMTGGDAQLDMSQVDGMNGVSDADVLRQHNVPNVIGN